MPNQKIAIFHNLAPGGAEEAITEFSKRLSKKYSLDLYIISKDQYKSISLEKKRYFQNLFLYDHQELRILEGGPFLRIQEDIDLFINLFNLYKKISIDINKRGYSLVFLSHDRYIQTPFLSRFLKIKSLYYCQEPWRIYYEHAMNPLNYKNLNIKNLYLRISDFLRKQADLINARLYSMILVNSYYSMESVFRAYGVYPYVCHLGVDLETFKPLKINKENFILSVGNLSPHKGHKFIIDAISLIEKKSRPKLYIASGGINYENSQKIKSYADSKEVIIKIIPRVSKNELVKLYNQATLTVCAAHLETLGLSALESMACETPVIAVKEGGYRDIIIDKVNGFLIDRSQDQLASTIKMVLKNSKKIQKVVKRARKMLFPYWTWEAATGRLIFYINKLLTS